MTVLGSPGTSFAQRLYGRRGSTVVRRLVLAGVALSSLSAGVMTVWVSLYLELSLREFALSLSVGLPSLWFGTALALYSKRALIDYIASWSASEQTEMDAVHMWDVLARAPLDLVLRAAVLTGVTGLPVAALEGVWISDLPLWSAVPVGIAVATSGVVAAVLILFGGELLLRPMMEDVAARLPADFRPRRLTWRLRAKLLAPLPGVALFGSLMAGAFVGLVDPGVERLVLALVVTTVTVLAMGLAFQVVMSSALAPLDELLVATRRVSAGDLTTTVPVVTADDLGQLAVSFNTMVGELRERTEELRASRARIVAAADAERRRVERDIHDGAQQGLVLAQLKLSVLRRVMADDPDAAARIAAEIGEDLHRANEDLRELARGIFPSVLETDGLPNALRDAAHRAALPVDVRTNGDGRVPREVEAAVYFCCLEALQNAAKHAGDGARVQVELHSSNGELRFCVDDDGAGFEPGETTIGTGLQGLTDRLGAVGGTVRIESRPGKGTRVAGTVPLA